MVFSEYERSFVPDCAHKGLMDYTLLRKCIANTRIYYDFLCKLYSCEGTLLNDHPEFRNRVIKSYYAQYVSPYN